MQIELNAGWPFCVYYLVVESAASCTSECDDAREKNHPVRRTAVLPPS